MKVIIESDYRERIAETHIRLIKEILFEALKYAVIKANEQNNEPENIQCDLLHEVINRLDEPEFLSDQEVDDFMTHIIHCDSCKKFIIRDPDLISSLNWNPSAVKP